MELPDLRLPFGKMDHPSQKKYRPNPARAVTIAGLFGDDSVKTALTEIKLLIERSSEPITIYIKTSRGGLLDALNQLGDMFASQEPNEERCHFVTVLQCAAHSAAAYLAVLT